MGQEFRDLGQPRQRKAISFQPRVCPHCHMPFQPTGPKQRFCKKRACREAMKMYRPEEAAPAPEVADSCPTCGSKDIYVQTDPLTGLLYQHCVRCKVVVRLSGWNQRGAHQDD